MGAPTTFPAAALHGSRESWASLGSRGSFAAVAAGMFRLLRSDVKSQVPLRRMAGWPRKEEGEASPGVWVTLPFAETLSPPGQRGGCARSGHRRGHWPWPVGVPPRQRRGDHEGGP